MDLILCRNVLIYLDEETVGRVAAHLFRTLAPGGWLITAAADPPLQNRAPFEVVTTDAGAFYRRPVSAIQEVCLERSPRSLPEQAGWPGLSPRSPGTAPPPTPSSPEVHSPGLRGLSPGHPDHPEGDPVREAVLHIRRLLQQDAAGAERACTEALADYPLSAELHFLRAVVLVALGRDEDAIAALGRVIYLDRTVAVAHFLLGILLTRRGDRAAARRAYHNVREVCAARPADEVVPFSEGETAGRLAEAAAFQLALLARTEETTS
jgi:chemotaxis protein methyltransferase CheR